MIASLSRIIDSGRWVSPQETLDEIVFEAIEPTAEDYRDILTLLNAEVISVFGQVKEGTLYLLDSDGYVRFVPELDDRLASLFPECVNLVLQHRRNIAEIRELGWSAEQTFSELVKLHHLAATYSPARRLRLTVVLHKQSCASKLVPSQFSAQLWFSFERLQHWLEENTFGTCLRSYASHNAPVVLLYDHNPSVHYDSFIVSFHGLPLTQHMARAYGEALQRKLGELTAVTNAPILHPTRFQNVDFQDWTNLPRLRELAAYAVLCVFSNSVTVEEDIYTFQYRVPGGLRSTSVTFSTGQLLGKDKSSIALAPELLVNVYALCEAYLSSINDSPSYRKVWEVVLEGTVGGNITRLLVDSVAVLKAFIDLREKVLDGNVSNIVATHEKAQTAVLQVSAQLTKDVDSLGGDVEKALFAGLGSGVLGLLGAYSKVQSLDLAAPVTAGLLATLFFPTVYGRLEYWRESLDSRKKDLQLFLESLSKQCAELVNLAPYQARFDEHEKLAVTQIDQASSRVSTLFGFVHLVALMGAFMVVHGSKDNLTRFLVPVLVVTYPVYVFVRVKGPPKWLRWFLGVTPAFVCIALALKLTGYL